MGPSRRSKEVWPAFEILLLKGSFDETASAATNQLGCCWGACLESFSIKFSSYRPCM
jgi:hypothetical protein